MSSSGVPTGAPPACSVPELSTMAAVGKGPGTPGVSVAIARVASSAKYRVLEPAGPYATAATPTPPAASAPATSVRLPACAGANEAARSEELDAPIAPARLSSRMAAAVGGRLAPTDATARPMARRSHAGENASARAYRSGYAPAAALHATWGPSVTPLPPFGMPNTSTVLPMPARSSMSVMGAADVSVSTSTASHTRPPVAWHVVMQRTASGALELYNVCSTGNHPVPTLAGSISATRDAAGASTLPPP